MNNQSIRLNQLVVSIDVPNRLTSDFYTKCNKALTQNIKGLLKSVSRHPIKVYKLVIIKDHNSRKQVSLPKNINI
jgi:hypothetical protein